MMDWKEALQQKMALGSIPVDDTPDPVTAADATKPDTLTVSIDRKGRKGKTATIVEGFTCDDAEVAHIASGLKSRLGVGGSSRGGEILIQGDYAARVADLLRAMGYKVKCC